MLFALFYAIFFILIFIYSFIHSFYPFIFSRIKCFYLHLPLLNKILYLLPLYLLYFSTAFLFSYPLSSSFFTLPLQPKGFLIVHYKGKELNASGGNYFAYRRPSYKKDTSKKCHHRRQSNVK